ncbi:MAG: hypothetical protein ACN4GM_11900 [Gammaproteobacteria bacterium]
MKGVLICLISALSCSCSPIAVPVVKEALKCEAPADLLAACGGSDLINEGITFGELIEISRRDRDALNECVLRHKSLADAVTACNENIENYNAEIRKINDRNAKR